MQKNTNEQINCYEISEDLINLLNEEHPDTLPDFEPSAFELGKMVGARDVINKIYLLTKSDEIQNILENADV